MIKFKRHLTIVCLFLLMFLFASCSTASPFVVDPNQEAFSKAEKELQRAYDDLVFDNESLLNWDKDFPFFSRNLSFPDVEYHWYVGSVYDADGRYIPNTYVDHNGKVTLPTQQGIRVEINVTLQIYYEISNSYTTGSLRAEKKWLFILKQDVKTGGNEDDDRLTITFWHAMGQSNQTVIDKMIKSFETKYPNYHVEQVSQGGYEDLLDKIKSNIKAGSGPVVAQTYPDHVVSYLTTKGAVVDLQEYAYDDEVGFEALGYDTDTYVKSFWEESFSYDNKGSMYSLPFNKSTEIIYYNQDIFAKYNWMVDICGYEPSEVYVDPTAAPTDRKFKADFVWNTTWEQLIAIGEAWTKTPEYAALVAAETQTAAFGYDSQSNLFITLTQQLASLDADKKYGNRGEKAYTMFDDQGVGHFTFLDEDNKYAKQAVEFYQTNYNKHYFATSGTLGVSYCSDAFKAEQCVVTVGSSAGASYNDGGEVFTTGVATYPQFEAAKPEQYQVIQQGTNLTLFSQADKELEKAGWLWILHMINFDNAYLWSTETAYFPIRTDVLESEQYQEYEKGAKVIGGQTIYNLSLKSKAASVAKTQAEWFYTNVTFNGSDTARVQVELLVKAVLLGESSLNDAFVNCKTALKDYIFE